jgi:hypothetical protein
MQPFGCNLCVVGGKNWPRIGSSVFLESAVGTELGQLGLWIALGVFIPRKERTRLLHLLHQTYDEYSVTRM